MSKKDFISGLDSLFDDAVNQEEKDLKIIESSKEPARASNRKTTTEKKSFTADLDSLFQEAIEESIEEQAQQRVVKTADSKNTSPKKRKRKKPLFGLDSLIRQTVETSKVKETPKGTKRVTFVFDKDKLATLKKIARLEKSYIKDIVGEIVAQYIDKYDLDSSLS